MCKTCEIYSTQCTSCDYFNGILLLLNTSGKVCVSACSIGEYVDLANKKCVTCDDGCAECYGPGLDNCTKCKMNFNSTPYYKDPVYNKCVTQCDTGQF